MKIKIIYLFLLITTSTLYAQKFPVSGVTDDGKKHLVQKAKKILLKYPDRHSEKLLNSISDSSTLIRVYWLAFEGEKYSFSKNPINFLKMGNFSAVWYLNNVDDKPIVIGAFEEYIGHPTSFGGTDDQYFYNSLKEVLPKLDLAKVTIFKIGMTEFHVLMDNKIYVVDYGHLIDFNTYYKKRYTLKTFKRLYNGAVLR